MNSETLDRLLIDRATGALTPDVEALLEAWLDREPGLASQAAETAETVRLARQVLLPPREAELPPLKVEPIPFAANRSRRDLAYALAACFTAGLVAGLLVMRGMPAASPRPSVVALNPPLPPPAAASSQFWSVQNLLSANRSAPAAAGPQVIWDSPVRKPRIIPST
jgi:hypothetical protein